MGILLDHMGRSFKGVIHVGANTGQEIDYYLASKVDHAVLVEPLDEAYGILCNKIASKQIHNYIPVQALCSSLDGIEYNFFIASNEGESSSFLRPTRHLIEAPAVKFNASVKLKSDTLDSVIARLEQSNLDFRLTDLDALVIDTQGSELHVLKGANRVLQQVTFIRSEVSFGGLYEGDASLEQIQDFLRCYGFRLFDLEMVRHGWGDACFLKL